VRPRSARPSGQRKDRPACRAVGSRWPSVKAPVVCEMGVLQRGIAVQQLLLPAVDLARLYPQRVRAFTRSRSFPNSTDILGIPSCSSADRPNQGSESRPSRAFRELRETGTALVAAEQTSRWRRSAFSSRRPSLGSIEAGSNSPVMPRLGAWTLAHWRTDYVNCSCC
jgi:hypothetical protein